jgi:hypothetical protein
VATSKRTFLIGYRLTCGSPATERGSLNGPVGNERAQEPTVGQGDDLARPLGLRHPPDVLYRIGLALTGLSTEVVREVAIVSDAWAVGSDPLKARALTLNVGANDGGEDKLEGVEITLDEGEASEREGRESHRGLCFATKGLYFILAFGTLSTRRIREKQEKRLEAAWPEDAERTRNPQPSESLQATVHLTFLSSLQVVAMAFGTSFSPATPRMRLAYLALPQQPIETASSPHLTASLPRMSPFVRRSLLGFRSTNTLSCVHLPLQPASRNRSASEPVGISSSWRVHISRPHRNCPPGCEAPRILHLFRLVRTRRFPLSHPALTASFQGPTGSELRLCPHPIGYQTSGYRRSPCSKYVRPLYPAQHLHSRLTCVPFRTVQ